MRTGCSGVVWAALVFGAFIAPPALGASNLDVDLESVPLYFIENGGQLDARVLYYVQGTKTSIYFERSGITFALREARQGWAVKVDFVDANPDVELVGTQASPTVVSYFRGERDRWHTAARTYGEVVYRDLWPGIDLVYAGSQSRLKYTFHVRPGADPSRIRLAVRGATDVRVTESGRLSLVTPAGGFDDDRPFAYQEPGGEKSEVASAYHLERRGDIFIYGFDVGAYDDTMSLVIDPVVLAYCGYLGGLGSDFAEDVVVDLVGNAYVVGYTTSTEADFPVTAGPDLTANGGEDAFVAKVDKSGKSLVYVGYIGGSGMDRGMGIAIDSAGNAYVTGETTSTEATFPVVGGPDTTFNGVRDAFVTKVDPSGTALVYSGYLGGAADDYGRALAVDGAGNAYLTGQTLSTEVSFPVAVGPDLTFNGTSDAFVAKVNAAGTAFVFVGYIGGTSTDVGSAIALDVSANVYVVGFTGSTEASFPVLVGPDTTYNGGTNDVFLTKVDATGVSLAYSGYVGGTGSDQGYALALDSSENVYVAGGTTSTEASFPVLVGPDITANGGFDAFVAKVDASGAFLVYCGYIGGATTDAIADIALDPSGSLYVTGNTDSTEASFPVRVGPDLTYNGGTFDAFVAKVTPTGDRLIFAGYIGGIANDTPQGLARDAAGNIYIAGATGSAETSFPVMLGPDLVANGGTDAFVLRLSPASPARLVGFETADAFEIVSFGTGATVDGITVRSGSGNFSMRQSSNPSVFATGLSLDNLALRFSFLKPGNPAGTQTLIQFKAGAANSWALELRSDGLLQVRQDEALGFPAGVFGSTPLANSIWYTVRLVYERRAGGILKVWRDTSLEINVTHTTAGTMVDTVEVDGAVPAYNYDDFYLLDVAELPPFGQIVRLAPNGPGLSTQFDTPVGVATHELNVDEPSPNDGDYNQHGASTKATDLYALTDAPTGAINAVKAMWRLRRGNGSGAGGTHDYAWAIDGVPTSRELVGLGTAFTDHQVIWTAPPETGERWFTSRVNGLELGASHNGTQAQDTDISFAAAMVDYDVSVTAVTLVSFAATPFDGSVGLEWCTGSEWNNAGFHIYRTTTRDGYYQRLTSSPIPGLGSSPEGATYHYVDDDVVNGQTYFYRLEDLEVGGKRALHGPVWATPEADAAGAGTEPEITPSLPPGSVRITYGEPAANRLEIHREGDDLVFVLETRGFSALAREDGTVTLEAPDFVFTPEVSKLVPLRRQWVEIPPGRRAEIHAARVFDVARFALGLAGEEPFLEASANGTVRAGRRPARVEGAPQSETGARIEPAEVVSLGFQGELRKALVQLAPFRYDERGGELVLARRLEARLSLRAPERAEPRDVKRRGRHRASHFKIATTEPGLYALRYEEVLGSGARGRAPRAQLALSRLGEPVPYHLEPEDRPFGPGSSLLFLSEGASLNPYGNEAIYELTFGESGEATSMPLADGRPRGGALLESYQHREEREENHLYQTRLSEVSWLWDMIPSASVKSYPVSVLALASASETSLLELRLYGMTDFPVKNDHHLRFSINGAFVGDVRFDGLEVQDVAIPLLPGVLVEGENALEIENVGDTGAAYSIVMLDRFALSYPRRPVAQAGSLRGHWSRSGDVAVEGLSQGYVLDVTSETPHFLVGARTDATGRLRFHADANRSYFVTSSTRYPAVTPVPEGKWTSTSHQADYVILGPRSFLGTVSPLARARQAEGLSVKVVPLEEIYDELGFGEARPDAIVAFLRHAYENWTKPSLRYVLLVGDGTYDFKGYLGTGVVNHVPPLLVRTSYLWTASDPGYAAVHGKDPLPDLSIGRLPAASVEELESMVDKLLAYEASIGSRSESIVLVTDNADRAGDFDHDAYDLMSSVLASRAPKHLSLSKLGAARTRESIVEAFDEGAFLMSYIGHGGIHLWADENLFNIADIGSLAPQSQPPILLTMNCLNGYFHFPYFDSLAEGLLKAPGSGVVAAVSPSGLSVNEPAHFFHRLLLEEILDGSNGRLGDAVLAAQERYADAGGPGELLRIFHVLGDPGLRLRLPNDP